ncbi:hypothetical protein BH09PLA1_BH09PLA1_24830 [soil metagenome]
MLPDLPGVFIATLVFALVALAPGWAVCYWANLLGFRRRFITFKLAIALSASVSVAPILLVLIARWTSLRTGAGVMLALVVLAVIATARELFGGRRRERGERIQTSRRRWISIVAILGIAWMILACAMLLDVRLSNGLNMSAPWMDHTKRVAWIDSIMRTGVPPNNPSTHPGHPVKMFYYYGWYVWAATVQTLGGGWINPIHVLIAGVVWSGWAFIASLALALRYLGGVALKRLRSCWLIASLLLSVTGLDILPGVVRLLLFLSGGPEGMPTSVGSTGSQTGAPRSGEWWNEQVTGFVDMMLWVPHHVCAVVIGIFMLSLFRWLMDETHRPSRGLSIIAPLVMMIALASLATVSLYVALPLAFFLLAYTGGCLWKRDARRSVTLIVAGVGAALLAAPYLADLLSAPGATAGIAITVRRFYPMERVMSAIGAPPYLVGLGNFITLPLNWFMELGFFALAGAIYWVWRRGERRPADRFAMGLLIASVVTASLLKSTISGNDLGWRSAMWAQIVLLVWAAEPTSAMWAAAFGTRTTSAAAETLIDRFPKSIAALLMLLALGAASTAYDLFLLRFSFPFWPEKEIEPARALAVRQAYEWISQHVPPNAVVQHNVNVGLDVFAGHYGNHQVVFADTQVTVAQGMSRTEFEHELNRLYELYMLPKPPTLVHQVMEEFDIAAIVCKDTDANWKRKESWFWTQPAIYQNDYVRVIATKDLLVPPATTSSSR